MQTVPSTRHRHAMAPAGLLQEPGAEGVFAEFFIEPEYRAFRSEQEGRQIFEDVEKIRIVIAGDKNSEFVGLATDEHRFDRFPVIYERFKAGMRGREQMVGTLLATWPLITPAWVKMLEGHEVHTVEQLGALSDTAIQRIGMGARELVKKAKDFLAVSQDQAKFSQVVSDQAKLREENETLRRQLAELNRTVMEKLGPAAEPQMPELQVRELIYDEATPAPQRPGRTKSKPLDQKAAFLAAAASDPE